MNNPLKRSYHPFITVAFYLNMLPDGILQQIPRSTAFEWKHKTVTQLFGYEYYCQNLHLFNTLQAVANNKKLLQVNKALLRIIAIRHFIKKYNNQLRLKLFNASATVLHNISKAQSVLGTPITLKLLQLSKQQYRSLLQIKKCSQSLFDLCLPKHPAQLVQKEVVMIKTYCQDIKYLHWPLTSVYHQLIRDGAGRFCKSTFYKYTTLLKLKRRKITGRRKNHSIGIRAAQPLQLLHADVTVFRTADHAKAFVHLVQDNFSRAILVHTAKKECKAGTTLSILQQVYAQYLQPAGMSDCQLITDDGSENHGTVQQFLNNTSLPFIQHIIAQKDVAFSNSMIEAANKNIKYHFLYHRHIPDFESLIRYLKEAIDDYNNRPHDVLNGLTPLEMLNGKQFDKTALQSQIANAKAARINENKQFKCCNYSF
jgi:hypothetical protein